MKRKRLQKWIARGTVGAALLRDRSVDPFLRFTPRDANLQTSVVKKVMIPTDPDQQPFDDATVVVVIGLAEVPNRSHRRRRA